MLPGTAVIDGVGTGDPGREVEGEAKPVPAVPSRGTGTLDGEPIVGLPGLLSGKRLAAAVLPVVVAEAKAPAATGTPARAACIACNGIVDLVIFDGLAAAVLASPEVVGLVGDPSTEAIEARFDIFLGAGLGLACTCVCVCGAICFLFGLVSAPAPLVEVAACILLCIWERTDTCCCF